MIAEYAKSVFSFVRKRQSLFQSGYTILHSHQQWMRVPVTPYPHQHLVLSVFQNLTILVVVQWYLLFSLCILLMIYDVEYLFVCLFALYIILVSCLLKSLAHFLVVFIFLQLSFKSSLYILDNSPLSVASFANIFSHSEGWLFILFMISFAVQKL